MGKLIRILIKTVSLTGLVLVVFLMNVYTTVFKKSAKDGESERFFSNDFSVNFSANRAFADAPASDPGGSDGSDTSDGSSGSDGSAK